MFRWAVGVGFLGYATDTATHEIGHAHGREHVNCGQGLDPNSIDNAYPHAGNTIGSWGWDIVGGGLINPGTYTDFMGYCDSQWISDYNFTAMFNRGNLINQALVGEPTDLALLSLDGEGDAQWMDPLMGAHALASPADLSVTVTDEQGRRAQVDAHYLRFDHLPGGYVVLPVSAMDAAELELRVDGITTIVEGGS